MGKKNAAWSLLLNFPAKEIASITSMCCTVGAVHFSFFNSLVPSLSRLLDVQQSMTSKTAEAAAQETPFVTGNLKLRKNCAATAVEIFSAAKPSFGKKEV